MQTQLLLGGGRPLIACDSADFDATNDYMTRGAGLTGAADSKSGILSAWIRLDGSNGSSLGIVETATTVGGVTPRLEFYRAPATNLFTIFGYNSAGATVFHLDSTTAYTSGATWLHVLCAWDVATAGKRSLYVNDVSDLTELAFNNDTIDYTVADWAIGALCNGTGKFDGCLAEIYFAPGQYLDFSIVANRRKFISPGGKPVFLGTDGHVPTGTAPLVYQHIADAEAVANFATNRGTGGNFTITGTLTTGSTSPSD